MPTSTEPRNPLYFLLLIAGVLFVATAFAYAVVPVLEQKALEAGQAPPPSPLRGVLRAYGGIALLVEMAAVVVLAVASMVWDRLRTLQKERKKGTIPPPNAEEQVPLTFCCKVTPCQPSHNAPLIYAVNSTATTTSITSRRTPKSPTRSSTGSCANWKK